jgi:[ribosomal protein S5]-alanine N-acetyltransferase
MQISFSPFPILKTERLILRKLSLDDAEEIFVFRSDDEVNKYLDRPRTKDIDEAIAFINKVNTSIANDILFYWGICLKDNPTLIGTICLWNLNEEENKAEVGYELHPGFHGKGIAKEALSKIIKFGFDDMQLDKIEAYTHKENLASTRLLEKFGFARDPHEESKIDFTVDDPNTIVYSLYKITLSFRPKGEIGIL